jgi:uracil-DNA glycosylase family 4
MSTTQERREELKSVFTEARGCTRCPELAATRTQVVFGAGNADADLMFVGEAPGAREDERGLPFVGAAGKLLEELLAEVGFARDDVFIANVLKCRPPGNRDPQAAEIENCQGYLFRQVELIRPKVICTLGNFATKLLRADPTGITRVHGRPEVRVVGTRAVRLYPIHHPAAALYTRSLQDTLRADFARLPGLLLEPEPDQPTPAPPEDIEPPDLTEGRPGVEPAPEPPSPQEPAPVASDPEPGPDQLGLF